MPLDFGEPGSLHVSGMKIAFALSVALGGGLVLAGCEEGLPECTMEREDLAYRVTYTTAGVPAYEGQAFVGSYCTNGFCHSAQAEGKARYGAPHGFNFDMALASNEDSLRRLDHGQQQVFDERDDVYGEVAEGAMPPLGRATDTALASRPEYSRPTRTGGPNDIPLPGPNTEEGIEILRNWLACGTPVVERTGTGTTSPVPVTVGDYVPMSAGIPIDPVWNTGPNSIYERIIFPRCGTSCHAGRDYIDSLYDQHLLELAGGPGADGLPTKDPDRAYMSLINVAAMAVDVCAGEQRRVVPGMPDQSLLWLKVDQGSNDDPDAVCGDPMPQSETGLAPLESEAIRMWIMMGAMDN